MDNLNKMYILRICICCQTANFTTRTIYFAEQLGASWVERMGYRSHYPLLTANTCTCTPHEIKDKMPSQYPLQKAAILLYPGIVQSLHCRIMFLFVSSEIIQHNASDESYYFFHLKQTRTHSQPAPIISYTNIQRKKTGGYQMPSPSLCILYK